MVGNYAKKLITNGIDGANAYLLIITAAAALPNHSHNVGM